MERFTLSNGIKVIFEKIDYVKSVTIGVFVGAGSAYENEDENGISHFLEHMFFKGTKKRNAKEIAEFMDSIGGQLNAVTSKEYTCFYAKVLYNHIEPAIDILSDMLLNSTFTQDNIELERKVITEEIKMIEDTPEELIFDMISEQMWKNSSLGRPIGGTYESVYNISRDNLLNYYNEHYCADNIVISVVGNYEVKILNKLLEKYFSHGFSNKYHKPVMLKKTEVGRGMLLKRKDIEQCQLCVSFEGFNRTNPMLYDLYAANNVFGGSMSSRLFQKIREENGLSYSVYSYINSYQNCGSFVIYAGMNSSELERVISLINDEIVKIKREKLSDKEILFAVEQIRSGMIMGLESMSNRMTSYGKKLLTENKVENINDIMNKVSGITKEKISDSIDRIFDLNKLNIAILGNVDEKNYISEFSF